MPPTSARERFLHSWHSRPHIVQGVRLRPFCLYYQLCLETLGSPLWSGGKFGWRDLWLAAQICRLPFEGLRPWLDADNVTTRLARVWSFHRFVRGSLDDAAAAFDAYLADHMAPPTAWETPTEDGDAPDVPSVLTVAARLEKATGWPEETVWTMPWGRAVWRATAYALLDGVDLNLMTETDLDLIADLERRTQEAGCPA